MNLLNPRANVDIKGFSLNSISLLHLLFDFIIQIDLDYLKV